MFTFLFTTAIHSMMAIVTIIALAALFGTTKNDVLTVAKNIGIGFLVYHSDSQKTFYCMSKRDALEWLAATYADAVIFSNWTKETIAIKLTKA